MKEINRHQIKRPINIQGPVDKLFETNTYPAPFSFNKEVADVFDNMVSRSVPLYAEVQDVMVDWALKYYQPNSKIIDIGCSTATSIELIARHMDKTGHFVGIDPSEDMIKKAIEKTNYLTKKHQLQFIVDTALNYNFSNASIVLINYVLQFLKISERRVLIQKIYDEILPGGILYLSEKTRAKNPELQETFTSIYLDFKHHQGYSRNEIARKKEALENVLVPLTYDEQVSMLEAAGFVVEPIMKWHQFTTFVAYKEF